MSGSGVRTITLTTGFPIITNPVTIDATTQPGYAGSPVVELDGTSAGATHGLAIRGGNSVIKGLAIYKFGWHGIVLITNGNNRVEGCYLGTDATGTNYRGNGFAGVAVVDSPNNVIGGTTTLTRNVISANGWGIQISDVGSRGTKILGNYIGTDASGNRRLGNFTDGILLSRIPESTSFVTDIIIGGTGLGERNIISDNDLSGIFMFNSTNIQILGNFIGTDWNGSVRMGNDIGITLENSPNNVISNNVISANTNIGVYLFESNSFNNRIAGNYIGTDVLGEVFMGNGQGIVITNCGSNQIGGTVSAARNLISGNDSSGINILGSLAISNIIRGNFIGVNDGGDVDIGNGGDGITLSATHHLIENNLISANLRDGINILTRGNSNVVRGNVIGTTKDSGSMLGNGRFGISIFESSHNIVGGTNNGARNIISGNASNGVFIGGSGAVSNRLQGNQIGGPDIGNRGNGIYITGSSGNWIGGTNQMEGNEISHNGSSLAQRGHGVVIESGRNNPILGNRIWANAGRGIDLGANSFTVNDWRDLDFGGANEFQNYPVLTKVRFDRAAGTYYQTWTLNSAPGSRFRLELFANSSVDPSGFGEGQRFLAATTLTTDSTGEGELRLGLPDSDQFISATATDLANLNTSEFSPVDTDGDAIADAWETTGIDYDEDGTIDLELNLADAFYKDVFVEIDAMTGRAPDMDNLSRVFLGTGNNDGFVNAPNELVQNPIDFDGIRLHNELDETDLPFEENWPDSSQVFGPFDLLKKDHFGTVVERSNPNAIMAKQLVYRYCIFANQATNLLGACRGLGANDFLVAKGPFSSVPDDNGVVSVFMHELGHSLGLNHGGIDGINYKPNYHSIMNYAWTHAINSPWTLDYSREEFAALNESHLIESVGIGASSAHVGHRVVIGPHLDGTNRLKTLHVPEFGPVDWNGNSNSMDIGVARDLNFLPGGKPSPGELLLPSEDWSKLRYNFLGNRFTTLKQESSSFSLSSFVPGESSGEITNDLDPSVLDALEKLGTATGLLQFRASVERVSETGSVAIITVTRAYETEGNVSVSFSTANGTATNGLDYVATNGVLTFLGSETVKTFNVRILNDGIAEPPETVRLLLSSPTGGATLGPRSEAILTIIDDDAPIRYTVINTNAGGAGSLRQAILDANATPGIAVIDFNIPGGSGLTISPSNALPLITDIVVIDGTTQPGYSNAPIIEISGASIGANDGLRLLGGYSTVRGLIVNRFIGIGISISGGPANKIEGCYIGLSRQGIADQGNNSHGVQTTSTNNVIGGRTLAARNFISGNNGAGVALSSAGNQVLGNVIGLGVDGSDIGNSGSGVFLLAAANQIGGAGFGAGNIISGNDQEGIQIVGERNIILGNFIGTALGGIGTRGNGSNGIIVRNSTGNIIGGTVLGARNIIAGNGRYGIDLSSSTSNSIYGNFIGVDVTGAGAAPNRFGGIVLNFSSRANIIGTIRGPTANTIAMNSGPGVLIAASGASNNVIRGNRIFSNSGLGLDLGSTGPLSNDTNDVDTGANQLQNHPILSAVTNSPSGTTIIGSLHSRSNATYTIDFYGNVAPDSFAGEGQFWLYSISVPTDSAGNANFTVETPIQYLKGRFISATATDAGGNTSEFSPCIPAVILQPGRTFTVVNTADSGQGSLRQAILDSNAHASEGNTIDFNIPGEGVQTIRPLSSLPDIENPVSIDGYSQRGAVQNSAAVGFNGVLLIQLDGAYSGIPNGLVIRAGNSVVRGLVINRFGTNNPFVSSSSGLKVQGFGGSRIEGNFIGTDPTGMLDRGNLFQGIHVVSSSNNIIGGLIPETRNIISGNNLVGAPGGVYDSGHGIFLQRPGSGAIPTDNRIEGNYIGVAADGSTPLPNDGLGVHISDVRRTTIGGVLPGGGNVIAFNGSTNAGPAFRGGVDDPLVGGGNAILGNSIHSNFEQGIIGDLVNSVHGVGNFPLLGSGMLSNGILTIRGRLNGISNALHRIEFFANTNFDRGGHPQGKHYLGYTNTLTDSNGFASFTAVFPAAVSNGQFLTATATDHENNTSEFSPRLMIGDALTNIIVVNTGNDIDDGIANAAHTSLREAIFAANNHSGFDSIRFAVPGFQTISVAASLPPVMDSTEFDGTSQPGYAGQPLIYLYGQRRANVAFRLYSARNVIRGLAIDAFNHGIYSDGLYSASVGHNVIEGNYIGTDRTGTQLGVQNFGISFQALCHSNRVGGRTATARNVISGHFGLGIGIYQSHGNIVEGNYIGADRTGTNALGNGGGADVPHVGGIYISDSKGTIIGGSAPASRNIISANWERNLTLQTCTDTLIQGNFIGTDVTGSKRLERSFDGVYINGGAENRVKDNLIAGFYATMLRLSTASNRVEGNIIGTDITGTRYISAGTTLSVAHTANIIGGTTPGSGNLIPGDIRLGCCNHIFQGNYVGVQPDGVSPITNLFSGIIIEGYGNLIGGLEPGAGNVIANISGAAISASLNFKSNAILRNSIFSNTGLAIDLGPSGVTTNDPGDLDSGPNELQNFPILAAARNTGAGTVIEGNLHSRSNTTFMVEFFSNTNCHPSGYGEGRFFVTSAPVTTGTDGNGVISLNYPDLLAPGLILTATATDPFGNTSEFGPCVTVVNDPNYVALSIRASGSSNIISWPAWAQGSLLERSTNLAPPISWQVISNGIASNSMYKTFVVTNDPAFPHLFFRLRRQ